MIFHEFPDLQWLKYQTEKNFSDRQGWRGRSLPHQGWPNVVLNVHADNVYRDNIRGPISVFSNFSGESFVEADKRRVRVREGFFFVTNHDQRYTLEVGQRKAETFNVHFGEYFTEQVLSSVSRDSALLLEDGAFVTPMERVNFHNNLYVKSDAFNCLMREIKFIRHDNLLLEEKLYALMVVLLRERIDVKKKEASLPAIKNSTKKEILKRLLIATDFIYSNFDKDLSLDELAILCCLSKFHFLRLFKIAFGQTPHQFINRVRMGRAKELLKGSKLEVNTISKLVGFRDASTFSRTFYGQVGVYPSQFR